MQSFQHSTEESYYVLIYYASTDHSNITLYEMLRSATNHEFALLKVPLFQFLADNRLPFSDRQHFNLQNSHSF